MEKREEGGEVWEEGMEAWEEEGWCMRIKIAMQRAGRIEIVWMDSPAKGRHVTSRGSVRLCVKRMRIVAMDSCVAPVGVRRIVRMLGRSVRIGVCAVSMMKMGIRVQMQNVGRVMRKMN